MLSTPKKQKSDVPQNGLFPTPASFLMSYRPSR